MGIEKDKNDDEVSTEGKTKVGKETSRFSKIVSDVFFVQDRIGKGGEMIHVIKIKTMEDGAEDNVPEEIRNGDKNHFDDPRVLTGRKWMRKVGIDELPQVINILKGDMGLFGVRPLVAENFKYLTPSEKERYISYKPGVLGGHAFNTRGKLKNIKLRQDMYLRLRKIKEKEGILACIKFHNYIFWKNISHILRGHHR